MNDNIKLSLAIFRQHLLIKLEDEISQKVLSNEMKDIYTLQKLKIQVEGSDNADNTIGKLQDTGCRENSREFLNRETKHKIK